MGVPFSLVQSLTNAISIVCTEFQIISISSDSTVLNAAIVEGQSRVHVSDRDILKCTAGHYMKLAVGQKRT